MNSLKILSGGAAQGLVESLTSAFENRTGWRIDGDFGAVGTMAAKLRVGAQTDLVILTDAIVAALERDDFVVQESIAPLGRVETAIAVRDGDSSVAIGDGDALRATFLAADALFVPDMTSSTAGQHVATILDRLGIVAQMAPKLREFPNGATAMREMAKQESGHPVGCTQSTEIIRTPGLTLVGPLPADYALATIYSAAVTRQASDPAVAQVLIDILTAKEHAEIRAHAGFLTIDDVARLGACLGRCES